MGEFSIFPILSIQASDKIWFTKNKVLPPWAEVNLLFCNGPVINYFRTCGDEIPVSTTVNAEGTIQSPQKENTNMGIPLCSNESLA
jgi:hypothetical protein